MPITGATQLYSTVNKTNHYHLSRHRFLELMSQQQWKHGGYFVVTHKLNSSIFLKMMRTRCSCYWICVGQEATCPRSIRPCQTVVLLMLITHYSDLSIKVSSLHWPYCMAVLSHTCMVILSHTPTAVWPIDFAVCK